MNRTIPARLTGTSYLIIFVAAIFANFFVLESILHDPMGAIGEHLPVASSTNFLTSSSK